ncbi:MAG: hypothetical protein Q7T74_06170 [Candidatus Saccharibacteria bacterium]|nr:hypothetical protein [Candidatus Saccharibacteria bacterium]
MNHTTHIDLTGRDRRSHQQMSTKAAVTHREVRRPSIFERAADRFSNLSGPQKTGAVIVGLAALLGSVSALGKFSDQPNPYEVNTREIAEMTPEQRAAQFITLEAHGGESIEDLAAKYLGRQDGSVNQDAINSLTDQALAADGNPELAPGETLYLPRIEP